MISVLWWRTYLRAVPDLLNGSLVELSRVSVEVLNVELLLNTVGVTTREASGVNVIDPVDVSVEAASILLQSNNVLVGDDFALLDCRGGSKSERQESCQAHGETAKVSHGELKRSVGENRSIKLGRVFETRDDEAVRNKTRVQNGGIC